MPWTAPGGDRIKNPYSELINHMRTQGAKYNTPYVGIGEVVSADPLTIKIGDLQIGKNNLLVADYLLSGYERKFSLPTTTASGTTTSGNINSIEIPNGVITLTDGLNVGDIVALTPLPDEQTYLILARLVSP